MRLAYCTAMNDGTMTVIPRQDVRLDDANVLDDVIWSSQPEADRDPSSHSAPEQSR